MVKKVWEWLKGQRTIVAVPLFGLVAYAFCFPLLTNLDLLCRGDWDYFFSLYQALLTSAVTHHQVPLWNPYFSGGMPLMGNPQQGFFSPIMLCTLPWGVVPGLKLAVWGHVVLGLWGAWALAGHFGCRGLVRFVPAAVFVFSSHWALHVTEGHMVWLGAAFMPWVVLFFLKGLSGGRGFLFAAASLEALIFYEGGMYVLAALVMFMFAYTLGLSWQEQSWRPLLWLMGLHILALMLMAPKLFPVVELMARHRHVLGPGEPIPGLQFLSFFFDRDQTLHREGVAHAGYWEVGAYLGVIAALLYGYGLSLFRRQAALVVSSVFMLLVCWGNFSVWAPWTLLHRVPGMDTLHIPMRLAFGFLLPAGLLAGMVLERMKERSRLLALLAALVLVADLFLVSGRIFGEAVRPWTLRGRGVVSEKNVFFQEAVPRNRKFGFGAWSDQFVFVYGNKGVVNAYEPVRVKAKAVARGTQKYRGESFLVHRRGRVKNVFWSPNRLVYDVVLSAEDILLINQNFFPGWRSSLGKVFSYEGRLAVRVPTGEHRLELEYRPASFLWGVGVLCLAVFAMLFRRKKERQ